MDFHIFEHVKFVCNPIGEGMHLYLGVCSFGLYTHKDKEEELLQSDVHLMRDFMYLPNNGECLLSSNAEQTNHGSLHRYIDKFSIMLCPTSEKVATCKRSISTESHNRR
jgi:hypothetical protein